MYQKSYRVRFVSNTYRPIERIEQQNISPEEIIEEEEKRQPQSTQE